MKTLLFPLIMLLKYLYLAIVRVSGSYGASLLFLSLINSLIMLWLGNLIKRYPERESLVQSLMAPKLAEINKEKSPELKHKKTLDLYKKYGYHPILALRSAFPLLLQLPFLFAAYHALSNLGALQAKGFYFVADLSQPDALLWGINLFPILMTAINVITALITPGFGKKDKIQAFIIAALFLLLLYRAASALLIFWTTNNIIFFIRTLFSRRNLSTAIPVRQTQFSFTRFKDIAIKQLPFLRQYFALLCLFYIYQIFALEAGYCFGSYLKYVPFLLAAFSLFMLQAFYAIRTFTTNPRYVLATSVLAAAITIVLFAFAALIVGSQYFLPANLSLKVNFLAYGFLMSAFLAGVFLPHSQFTEHKDIWKRLLVLIIMPLIPATHYAKVNSEYLLGSYKYYYYIVIIGIAFLNYIVLHFVAGQGTEKRESALKSAFFTLFLIFLPVFRFALRLTSKVDIDFWVTLFIALFLLHFINTENRYRRFLQISAIVLAVFVASSLFSHKSAYKGAYPRKVLSQKMAQIELKEKPNIYLFVYDGIPNERVFQQQNMPFQDLKRILNEYSFKLYPDTYTLGDASLNSMGRMLDFTNRVIKSPEGRDIYSGNSYVNLILRNNGYKSRFVLDNYFVGNNAITHKDLFDEMYPPRAANAAQSDYFVVLFRGIMQGEMRFDTRGLVSIEETDTQDYKHTLIKEAKESTFVVNHYHYPGHSQNSGKCLPNETELWLEKFAIALQQMEIDFQTIQEHDPGSIVIAIGDHGPSLTGDCFDLAAWKKEDITEELIWDRIGTMVAIRWPNAEKGTKYDSRIIKNQDIFPVIFSYLADSSEPLKLCAEDTFWGLATPFRTDIGFDKGKIILER